MRHHKKHQLHNRLMQETFGKFSSCLQTPRCCRETLQPRGRKSNHHPQSFAISSRPEWGEGRGIDYLTHVPNRKKKKRLVANSWLCTQSTLSLAWPDPSLTMRDQSVVQAKQIVDSRTDRTHEAHVGEVLQRQIFQNKHQDFAGQVYETVAVLKTSLKSLGRSRHSLSRVPSWLQKRSKWPKSRRFFSRTNKAVNSLAPKRVALVAAFKQEQISERKQTAKKYSNQVQRSKAMLNQQVLC